jgi:periplasmic protein TonB
MTASEQTKQPDGLPSGCGGMLGERGPEAASPQRRGAADGLADLGKVIPFSRGRRSEPNQEPTSEAAGDIALPVIKPERADRASGAERGPLLALLALSALVHAGALMLLNREPQPMASVRLDAISVEIVLGADAPAAPQLQPDPVKTAGHAPDPAVDQPSVQPDTPPDKPDTRPDTTAQQQMPEQQAVTETEQSPAQTDTPPDKIDTPPQTTAPQQMPQQQQQQAATDTAAPTEMTAPATAARPEPEPTPPATAPVAPPQPDHRPVAQKPAAADRHHAHRPVAAETRHKAAEAKAESKKVAALPPDSGSPRSHSAADPNYRGLVAAHLQRYKPSGRSEQGSAVVSFTLDGSGRVTRVALAHSSGVPVLDQETEAMVHRASPFPAPPDGRPISFTVPVNFHAR